MDDLKENPFAALFPSVTVAQSYKDSQNADRPKIESPPVKNVDLSNQETVKDVQELNAARIYAPGLFTLRLFTALQNGIPCGWQIIYMEPSVE